MLFRFFWHQKQCARLLRGFTVARISPQWGHTKRKYPSLILHGGPSRPSAAMVTGIGRSLRSRRSSSESIVVSPCTSEVDQVGCFLPAALPQDAVDVVDVDGPAATAQRLGHAPNTNV